jgi:hypothetical protein
MGFAMGRLVALLGFSVGVATIPHRLSAVGAAEWFAGDAEKQEAMAKAVDHWVADGVVKKTFPTGSSRFDSEWIFGTYQMAALGFGQVALEHPETKAVERTRMERAIDRMLAPSARGFDTEAWGRDALGVLDSDEGHAAFLGYTNLVLSLHRFAYPDSKYAALNEDLTKALEHRFSRSCELNLAAGLGVRVDGKDYGPAHTRYLSNSSDTVPSAGAFVAVVSGVEPGQHQVSAWTKDGTKVADDTVVVEKDSLTFMNWFMPSRTPGSSD